ncbi:hypothetical protein PV371_37330 [Streptomyces sp. TX20-6-3]|uniref:hypothetical protein n=1 Tax=Streptomyces sp. TX20-6-3 TaxID=3028705 RepID=UPI0029BA239D|nr:hypothetical protein [Streptomyces sp. TX20-6-3]MDX2565263.1 hypothetical protein [Streptomyces sp. TX20-6-3]
MSAPAGDDGGAVRRARVLRLETLRDIEALLRELEELHAELAACEDSDEERVWDLLHAAGVMTGVWLDDIACRFAETDHDADELFARAWQFVEDLGLAPGGFLTRDDPALFTTLRGSTASMLARLWVTGYLLGPIPEDVWPDRELAILLLRALEHHADARALTETLDHHHASQDASPPTEKPGNDEEPGGTQAEPP